MIVFVDMDGVVADFVGGAKLLIENNGYKQITDCTNYKIESWYGLSTKEFWRIIDGEKDWFWSELNRLDHAIDLINTAKMVGSVYFLTSPSRSPYCFSGKKYWVDHHFPNLSGNLIIAKDKYLLAGKDRLLIDDSEQKTSDFTAQGGNSILFPQPWNKNRDKSYEDVKNALLELV